eukprot:3392545-Amphidinium_carterae.1
MLAISFLRIPAALPSTYLSYVLVEEHTKDRANIRSSSNPTGATSSFKGQANHWNKTERR